MIYSQFELIGLKDLLIQNCTKCKILYCIIIFTVNRSNEDIVMQVCEPYTLHQSKPTDDVVYDECQQPTAVYESMHN